MKWIVAALAIGIVLFFAVTKVIGGGRNDAGGSGQITSELIPDGQASITVEGWRKEDIRKILHDFCQKYGLDQNSISIETDSGGVSYVHFLGGIPADKLLYLLNYIYYPNDFDLDGRHIIATANAVIDKYFGPPTSEIEGRGVVFYIPSHDKDYDQVYAMVDRQRYYRIPFTNLSWITVSDPRLPTKLVHSN